MELLESMEKGISFPTVSVLLSQPQTTLPALPSPAWCGGFPAQSLDLPTDFPGEEWGVGGHSGDLLAQLSPGQVPC